MKETAPICPQENHQYGTPLVRENGTHETGEVVASLTLQLDGITEPVDKSPCGHQEITTGQ